MASVALFVLEATTVAAYVFTSQIVVTLWHAHSLSAAFQTTSCPTSADTSIGATVSSNSIQRSEARRDSTTYRGSAAWQKSQQGKRLNKAVQLQLIIRMKRSTPSNRCDICNSSDCQCRTKRGKTSHQYQSALHNLFCTRTVISQDLATKCAVSIHLCCWLWPPIGSWLSIFLPSSIISFHQMG